MDTVKLLNPVLWFTQGFLALFFLGAAVPKIIGRGAERWTGFSDLPRILTFFIGVAELLGAVGLVLPLATGILPWLTPLAASGLGIIVLMASGFHLRADERLPAVETVLWAVLTIIVAIGRWSAMPIRAVALAELLVGLVGLLVPSVIMIVTILLRRPIPSAASR